MKSYKAMRIIFMIILIEVFLKLFFTRYVNSEIISPTLKVKAIKGIRFVPLENKVVYQSVHTLFFKAEWEIVNVIAKPPDLRITNKLPLRNRTLTSPTTTVAPKSTVSTRPTWLNVTQRVRHIVTNPTNRNNRQIAAQHSRYSIPEVRSIRYLPNAYNMKISNNVAMEYSITSYLKSHVENKKGLVPVGNWQKYFEHERQIMAPSWLQGIEPDWFIIEQQIWPIEYQISLYEHIVGLLLPSYHPDYRFKSKPLGIIRLMPLNNYTAYQTLQIKFTKYQKYVEYLTELPPGYVDYRSLFMRRGLKAFEASELEEISDNELTFNDQYLPNNTIKRSLTISPVGNKSTDFSFDTQMHQPMVDSLLRQKRSPGFLSFCCDVIYASDLKELYLDKQIIEDYMTKVKDSLTLEEQQIDKLKQSITSVDVQLDSDMTVLKTKLSKMVQGMTVEEKDIETIHDTQLHLIHSLNYLLLEVEYAHRNISLAECRLKHIPHYIIPKYKMASKLVELQKTLEADNINFKLAVPYEETSFYFKQQLADCMFGNSSVFIQVKVPLKKKHEAYRVYKTTRIPFIYNQEVCHFTNIPSHVAISNLKSIRVLDAQDNEDCLDSKSSLCLLTQYPRNYQPEVECIRKLYYENSMKDIVKVCKFRCHSSSEPVITQINPTHYTILNPTTIPITVTVKCQGEKQIKKTQQFKISQLGSFLMELPCKCTAGINYNSFTKYIEGQYPCESQMSRNFMLTHTVPIFWLRDKSYMITNETGHYLSLIEQNLTSLLDSDMTDLHGANIKEQLDIINATLALQNLKVPVLFNMDYQTTTWTNTIWLTLLTLAFILAELYIIKKFCKCQLPTAENMPGYTYYARYSRRQTPVHRNRRGSNRSTRSDNFDQHRRISQLSQGHSQRDEQVQLTRERTPPTVHRGETLRQAHRISRAEFGGSHHLTQAPDVPERPGTSGTRINPSGNLTRQNTGSRHSLGTLSQGMEMREFRPVTSNFGQSTTEVHIV
jgi:hypothetical protein